MSKPKMYVCVSITVMLSDRSMIAPGTPFKGEDMHPATLASMIKNETVQEFTPEAPQRPAPKYPIGKTDTGINPEEKKEGTNEIGLHRRPPEKKTDEALARKNLVKAKLKARGITMPHNARLDTMEARLAAEEDSAANLAPEKSEPKGTGTEKLDPAQCVWDADPEEIKDLPYDRLLTIYRDRCAEFNIELQRFESQELLVKYMSSEFVKKE